MITRADLREIMPQAAENAIDGFMEPLNDAMDEFGIDSPERQSAFLAQIAHESGQLRHLREIWGPTDAQVRYEGRADLGNFEPGDGFKYRGRGLIQITGRSNYAACGNALGLDLISQPQLLEQPVPACRSAGWFWQSRKLNVLADRGDFTTITRRVNGGLNGYEDRARFWERAKRVLGA